MTTDASGQTGGGVAAGNPPRTRETEIMQTRVNTRLHPAGTRQAPGGTTLIKRHSVATRVWHWLNLACVIVLLMSGLQIFNAHPALYWGSGSSFAHPWLEIGARMGPNGQPTGVTRIAGHAFDTTGLLGLSTQGGQSVARAFPSWATLPGVQWLAMGRHWHFFAAWIFVPSMLTYLVYTLLSRRRRRLVFPTAEQWRGLPRTVAAHARLRFHHEADYNALQKLTYILVLFGLLPLMMLTGLTMSPTMDAAWPWLLHLFGGRQSARTIHFLCAFSLVGFFLVHIALVLVSGVFNNLRSMITGRYRIDQSGERDPEYPQ